MSISDREHFEEYRRQTEIKHLILSSYLPPFFYIVGKSGAPIFYIDGFAGPGLYRDVSSGAEAAGSPLRVLDLLARDAKLAKAVQCIFIEQDLDLCNELRDRTGLFLDSHPGIIRPMIEHGSFEEAMREVVNRLEQKQLRLAPTFLFVDPCGVQGYGLRTITTMLKQYACELFVFFNLDGVRRILGLDCAEGESQTLTELLGNASRVKALRAKFDTAPHSAARENIVIQAYIDAIREESAAQYFLPFYVEYEHRRIGSHVLLHATKSATGFRIMKDVMWKAGASGDAASGGLELRQASANDLSVLMREDIAAARAEVLSRLAVGHCRVGDICNKWAERPTDVVSARFYKELLKQMEADGVLVVYDKTNSSITPSNARKKSAKGDVTLANEFWLRAK